jgi:LmbE family N-acetylglucosaminyl deacetylase
MRIPSAPVAAVLAHPDDIKCVLGVAQRAMSQDCPVTLFLTTCGEGLRSTARGGTPPLEMGALRMEELRRFLAQVGIADLRLIGIPDGSQTLPAMRDDFYCAQGAPFVDPLLGVDSVPYDDALQPGLHFFGEALLALLMEQLAALGPGLVLTHHPQDDHADHRAVSFFARRACRRLAHEKRLSPLIYAPLVYYRRYTWPPQGDYFYSETIAAQFPGLRAEQFLLREDEYARKVAASQILVPTLSAEYIASNMKRDEVLWRL